MDKYTDDESRIENNKSNVRQPNYNKFDGEQSSSLNLENHRFSEFYICAKFAHLLLFRPEEIDKHVIDKIFPFPQLPVLRTVMFVSWGWMAGAVIGRLLHKTGTGKGLLIGTIVGGLKAAYINRYSCNK